MKKIVMTAALAIAAFAGAQAQYSYNSPVSQGVTLSMDPVIEMTPTAAATATGNFTTVANYDNGVSFGSTNWTIKSNWDYNIYAMAEGTGSLFTYLGPSSIYHDMPLTALQLKASSATGMGSLDAGGIKNGFDNFQTLNATYGDGMSATFGARIARGEVGDRTLTTEYKVVPGWNYAAGTYTATVKVTATMP